MTANDTTLAESRAIRRGALVNLIGVVASSLGFAFFLILGRLYGADVCGLYLLAWSILDIVSKLGILGLDRALLTLVAKREAVGDGEGVYRLLAQALFVGGGATALVLLLLRLLAEFLMDQFGADRRLLSPLVIMSWGLPFWTLSAIFVHVARAFRIMRYEVLTKRVAEPTLLLLGGVLAYVLGFGQTGLAVAFVISAAGGALLGAFLLNRRLPLLALWPHLKRPALPQALLRFCAPIGVYDLLNLLLQRMDLFFVGYFLPFAAAGVYGLAQETAFAAKKIRQIFDPILIPVLAQANEQARRADLLAHYRQVTTWILVVDLAIVGVMVLAGRSVLSLYGGEFVGGAACLALLTLAVAINGVLGVAELFVLLEQPALNLVNSIAALVTVAVMGFALTPLWGMEGAALSVVGAFVVMNAMRLVQVWRRYRLSPFAKAHAALLLVALLSLLPALLVGPPWAAFDPLRECLAVAVFLALYGVFAARRRRLFGAAR